MFLDPREWPPVVLLTSHLPKPGSSGDTMLKIALARGVYMDVVELYRPETNPDLKLRLLAVGGRILAQ